MGKIKHFLVIYDISERNVHVKQFGTDEDAAVAAYDEAERNHRGRDDVDIVLLGAESLAVIKKTHSSYFQQDGEHRFNELLLS